MRLGMKVPVPGPAPASWTPVASVGLDDVVESRGSPAKIGATLEQTGIDFRF